MAKGHKTALFLRYQWQKCYVILKKVYDPTKVNSSVLHYNMNT